MTRGAPRPCLTGVLREIAEVLGEDWAERVASDLGGRHVWLSTRPGPQSPLARVVGVERARRLAEALGPGDKILIPMGPYAGEAGRRRRIAQLLAEGWAQARIAGAVGVHLRTVERVAATLRPNPTQPGLFDD